MPQRHRLFLHLSWVKFLRRTYLSPYTHELTTFFFGIPHDLLVAKLNAYGFDQKTLSLIYSYLKNRKQSVRINNVYSTFLELISGVLQGSVLVALL